uniref:thymidylate synthase n=1 Tax=viral metagenome TaxID=1070528 RepID=A0A6C0JHC5_9ZZZZ
MSEHEEFKSLPYINDLLVKKSLISDTDKNKEEMQYLNLIQNILDNGFLEVGRNGKTLSIFGDSMRFSLKNGKIPILTTKKVAWKTCLKELLWFIRGETDNKILQRENVHIWDGNSSKEFKKSVGLEHYPEGILGTIYGYQWRHFNAPYDLINGTILDENKPGIDQLQYIIEQLKNPETRNSRRLIMSAWNPCQLNKMVLPPCHVMCHFNVHDGNKLSCSMYQRSVDVPIGSPFNIASYSFLTHLLAKHCDLEPHEFVYFMGNCHIYEEHLESIKEQLVRTPYEFPNLEIINKRENINDYVVDDFKVIGYKSHDVIKMNMVA